MLLGFVPSGAKEKRMSRVIFVGLHNKPGMEPLDSQTKSGKLVDFISLSLKSKGRGIVKTNLYNVEYLPKGKEANDLAFDWIERVKLYKEDTVVLLGKIVQEKFPKLPLVKIIKVEHPAKRRTSEALTQYIQSTVDEILS
jgi:hypothetical protein